MGYRPWLATWRMRKCLYDGKKVTNSDPPTDCSKLFKLLIYWKYYMIYKLYNG